MQRDQIKKYIIQHFLDKGWEFDESLLKNVRIVEQDSYAYF